MPLDKVIAIFKKYCDAFRSKFERVERVQSAETKEGESELTGEGDMLVPAFVMIFLFIKTLNPLKLDNDVKSLGVCDLFRENVNKESISHQDRSILSLELPSTEIVT